MRKMLYCLIVIFLSGCLPDKLLDTLVLKSQSIINNNDSKMKYLLAYQMSNNVNGVVFQLFYNDNPCFEPTGEYPTKTIKYKDKYICVFNPWIKSSTAYNDILECFSDTNTIFPWDDRIWYVGISLDGKQCDMIETSKNNKLAGLPYHFPSLLKYIYKEYSEHNIPRFIFEDYEFIVDNNYESKKTMKGYFQQLSGTIYFSNPHDDCFSDLKERSFFGTLNGKDTLKFFVSDTINQRLFIDSVYHSSFIENLPSNNTWYHFLQLLEDSTYYFRRRRNVIDKTPVPFSRIPLQIYVTDTEGNIKDVFCKNGNAIKID